jgi:predicted SAM-dependent methyltransferase
MRVSLIRRKISSPQIKDLKGKVCIHLGCGMVNDPGFINVDFLPLNHVHYVHDVKDLSFFSDNFADLIYACHVLEHVSYREIPKVLNEWRRVVKQGGVLRLSVPDFNKLLSVYSTEKNNITSIIEPLMGGQDYPFNFHRAIFNKQYLTDMLLNAGFTDIRQWDPKTADMHSFDDWASLPIDVTGRKYFISLNLEATKP